MKNIFLLPTPNPSRLQLQINGDFHIENGKTIALKSFQNIYITSDSKFVRDEYITDGIKVIKATPKLVDAQGLVDRRDWKKIIITTDPELIKDGVHPIGEEFLKWFVKNPTCIKVEVVYGLFNPMGRQVDPNDLGQNHSKCVWKYKIITTKEEQKQHLIDMMKGDEELGLYDVFNDEKREGVKRVIQQHKILKSLSLVNPLHLQMTSNGYGEFPDGYKLTEKGIQYIIEELSKLQEQKMYSEQEVRDLLETQRGNCYVAILSQTKNDEIATIAIQSPEPGGKNGTWVK